MRSILGAAIVVAAAAIIPGAFHSASAGSVPCEDLLKDLRAAEQGAQISAQVAGSLDSIVQKIRQLDEMFGSIAQASHEQSECIGQLNQAVAGMDQITQANAALAQQSATSAEELQGQSAQVRAAVEELMHMVHGEAQRHVASAAHVTAKPAKAHAKSAAARAPAAIVSPRLAAAGTPRAAAEPSEAHFIDQ